MKAEAGQTLMPALILIALLAAILLTSMSLVTKVSERHRLRSGFAASRLRMASDVMAEIPSEVRAAGLNCFVSETGRAPYLIRRQTCLECPRSGRYWMVSELFGSSVGCRGSSQASALPASTFSHPFTCTVHSGASTTGITDGNLLVTGTVTAASATGNGRFPFGSTGWLKIQGVFIADSPAVILAAGDVEFSKIQTLSSTAATMTIISLTGRVVTGLVRGPVRLNVWSAKDPSSWRAFRNVTGIPRWRECRITGVSTP